jgi:carbon-monoxide dehydrogenase medium subunit
MTLPKFTYLSPKDLKEASALLVEHGDKARLMAGGTDLLIRMSHRALTPEFVIGLRNCQGLEDVHFDPAEGLTIGAMTRLRDVADHDEIKRHYPALAHAARLTATVQIRNMGTVVGNVCNAAPSADTATPLLVYGGEAVVVHPGGRRTVPLNEFFRGPGLTALEKGELVRSIVLPPPGDKSGADYQKISARSKVDIAAVGVSAYLQLDDQGAIGRVRVALGAVAPVPMRAKAAEKILGGQAPSEELFAEAAAKAQDEANPISDMRASAAWRKTMVGALTRRALEKAHDIASQRLAGCEI